MEGSQTNTHHSSHLIPPQRTMIFLPWHHRAQSQSRSCSICISLNRFSVSHSFPMLSSSFSFVRQAAWGADSLRLGNARMNIPTHWSGVAALCACSCDWIDMKLTDVDSDVDVNGVAHFECLADGCRVR
jgi:hypothetical protein